MTAELEPGRQRTVWPMYVFVAVLLGIGCAMTYVLVWLRLEDPHSRGPGPYSLLVAVAPFAAAAAAYRATREQVHEDRRLAAARDDARRERLRSDKQEMLAPFPVEPVGRGVDGGPFRAAPGPRPIVARVVGAGPAPAAPIVPGGGEPPKHLT